MRAIAADPSAEIAAVNARIDAIAFAARNEMKAALEALDRLAAALAALEALDTRYVAAVWDVHPQVLRRGGHTRPIFAPFHRELAAALTARLWAASPAACHELALLPDPTKPLASNAAVLAEAMRDASRWRIDPAAGVPEAA